jgi:hypothetical protein
MQMPHKIITVDNFMIEELLNIDQASVDNSKVVAKMVIPRQAAPTLSCRAKRLNNFPSNYSNL